jgi:hypothetical protein
MAEDGRDPRHEPDALMERTRRVSQIALDRWRAESRRTRGDSHDDPRIPNR